MKVVTQSASSGIEGTAGFKATCQVDLHAYGMHHRAWAMYLES